MYMEKKDVGRNRIEVNNLKGKYLRQPLIWLQHWSQTAANPAMMEKSQFKSSGVWFWAPHLNFFNNLDFKVELW